MGQWRAGRGAKRGAKHAGTNGTPRGAVGASYVLRVELRQHGGRCYLLHDLRSGELHRFRLAVNLQRWLKGAGLVGLK